MGEIKPGQRGSNVDDPVRAAVPLSELTPWPVLGLTPDGEPCFVCAECGWEVDEGGLWHDRHDHKPAQVGVWCSRCGRRWRYRLHPNSREAILEHNATHNWQTNKNPEPEEEISRLPNRVAQGEVLPRTPGSPGRYREPRVLDKMREVQEELAEDMVRPFRVALGLRPDEETDAEGEPKYETPQLLRLLHQQARMAERLMDRTIGTPVQRNANLNFDGGAKPGQDVSMRAVDETVLALINGELPFEDGE
jgi:hypothetical protein